jgi:hypothetical protein
MVLTRNVFNEANSVPFEQKQIMFKFEYTKFKKIKKKIAYWKKSKLIEKCKLSFFQYYESLCNEISNLFLSEGKEREKVRK